MECAICNRFRGRWKIETRAEALAHRNRRRGTRSWMVSNHTWDDILTSAQTCYGCDILVTGCRGCFTSQDLDESSIVHVNLRFYYPSTTEDLDEETQKHLMFHLKNGQRFDVELFATDDDDCPIPESWDYMPTSNRTSQRSDSAMALAKIKSWVAGCVVDDSDSYCESPECPQLPTRVIDVGLDDGIVKLVETQGTRSKYICLSHCWGLEQIITTTKPTIEERKRQVEWSALSKTFQDAITLTRALGYRYIWIDSLCIIQDDAKDWEVESSMMASVYSNGFLTIAATQARSGAGGLYTQNKDYRVAGQTPEGEHYCLFFRERIDHQIDAQFDLPDGVSADKYLITGTDKHFPLLSRAWVYQERMLSTRVLHFGRYEMLFECRSSIDCECSLIRFQGAGFETMLPLIKVEHADALTQYTNDRRESGQVEVRYQGARLWRTMVSCYTALALTKSTDRLIAFGGLARQMANSRRSEYLAGVWRDSLQDDLLWDVRTTSRLKKSRPQPRNAPTWSWASVETAVGYWDIIVFTDLEGNAVEERAPFEHFTTIEDCRVSKTSIDEFGSITQGHLIITGLVVEGLLEREVETFENTERINHSISILGSQLPIASDYFLDHDGPNKVDPGSAILCLRMSLYQEQSKQCLYSLILRQCPLEPNIFERIGTLRISGSIGSVDPDSGIFHGAQTRTVVIA